MKKHQFVAEIFVFDWKSSNEIIEHAVHIIGYRYCELIDQTECKLVYDLADKLDFKLRKLLGKIDFKWRRMATACGPNQFQLYNFVYSQIVQVQRRVSQFHSPEYLARRVHTYHGMTMEQ